MVNKITSIDEFEAEFKKGIGLEQEFPAHYDASKDNILLFCDAVGDHNPLWIDEEYAKKSRFGMITAPPTFLHKVRPANTTLGVPRWPGAPFIPNELGALFAGFELESLRPIWVGDRFTVKAKITDIFRKQTKSRGPTIFSVVEASYTNQRQELVGTLRQTMNYATLTAGRGGVPAVHDPDKPGVVAKDANVLAFEQKRRGAEPRYWEDVEVGEEMTPPLEKGAYTVTEMNRFSVNVQYAPRILTGERGGAGGSGLEREAAWRPHDFGQQRAAWLGWFLTDWMGDEGTLKKLAVQIRRQNWIGDLNVCKGKVTKKYIEDGEHLVDCDIFVENQGGVVTAPGRGTVVLPSKKRG